MGQFTQGRAWSSQLSGRSHPATAKRLESLESAMGRPLRKVGKDLGLAPGPFGLGALAACSVACAGAAVEPTECSPLSDVVAARRACGRRLAGRPTRCPPCPVLDLRHVVAIAADVLAVVDQFVAQ